MAKKTRPELLDTTAAFEEAMYGDNGDSEEERKFQEAVRDALEQGRIPIECIELIPVSEDMAMKTVVAKEC